MADFWQQQEQDELRQRIEEALDRCSEGHASKDDIRLLAWAAGIQLKTEAQHGMEG